MKRRGAENGDGKIGCIIWLAIVVLLGYSLSRIVPTKIRDSKFEDFMTEEAGFGSIKSSKQLEKEILAKARELEIPVTQDNLRISLKKEEITVEAHYELVFDFFGGAYKYVWKRDHVIKRPLFAV